MSESAATATAAAAEATDDGGSICESSSATDDGESTNASVPAADDDESTSSSSASGDGAARVVLPAAMLSDANTELEATVCVLLDSVTTLMDKVSAGMKAGRRMAQDVTTLTAGTAILGKLLDMHTGPEFSVHLETLLRAWRTSLLHATLNIPMDRLIDFQPVVDAWADDVNVYWHEVAR